MTDSIERSIELKAPVARVWQALTDHREFGAWFRVKLDTPFQPGAVTRGTIAHPGYEHLIWEARIVEMEAPHRFVFTWHPYAVDPAVDYASEPPTTVTFTLAPIPEGTHLTVVESGFDQVPEWRRDEALRMNGKGWSAQMDNIRAHVEA